MPAVVIFTMQPAEEGGYIARAVGYSIFSEGESFDELARNVREATEAFFGDGVHRKIELVADITEFASV
jgi:predicted RNase H-like HicB family nuclease